MGTRTAAGYPTSGGVLAELACRAVRGCHRSGRSVGALKTVNKVRIFAICLACGASSVAFAQSAGPVGAQPAAAAATVTSAPAAPPVLPAGVTPPTGYTIGPEDQLSIVYWREKDLSADVVV